MLLPSLLFGQGTVRVVKAAPNYANNTLNLPWADTLGRLHMRCDSGCIGALSTLDSIRVVAFVDSIRGALPSGTRHLGRVAVDSILANQTHVGRVAVDSILAGQTHIGRVAVDSILVAGAASSSPIGTVDEGNTLGRAAVMKTGSVTTTSTTNTVVVTYTVTTGKTFYLTYANCEADLTVLSATASLLGSVLLESPAATTLLTHRMQNLTTEAIDRVFYTFPGYVPIASATVVRWTATASGATSTIWQCNFGGYEK